MIDLRPVGYVIGLMVLALGLAMVLPMLVDIAEARGHWPVFAESAVITMLVGGLVALACRNGVREGLTIQQAFLLTTGVWVILPIFGALPFILGATEARFVDAVFEAMSGVTTTGSTILTGLDGLPKGLLLWRSILQWMGGLGIVIVAIVFLPIMRVGGMQFFVSEGFDTFGKVLPRAIDISQGVLNVYLLLTFACMAGYLLFGMSVFDAVSHALTTVSTGGFSTSDQSFGAFSGAAQYVSVVFMILASMPFVRLMQALAGEPKPFFRDVQARTYVRWIVYAVLIVVVYDIVVQGDVSEERIRERLFNVVSIFSGTGYGDGDVMAWGSMPFVILFLVGAIGGCTGSTGCSIKIFRYEILLRAIAYQVKVILHPHRMLSVRYQGQRVDENVIQSVILLFTLYILTFGFLSVMLQMTGLSFMEAVTGAWTAIFNVGPAFGDAVGPTGALDGFPTTAKWLMIFGMLLGRLELVAVFVLFLPFFWRF